MTVTVTVTVTIFLIRERFILRVFTKKTVAMVFDESTTVTSVGVGVGVCGLQEMTDGVTRYDEENIARRENGFWADHNPRKPEDVGPRDTVPWVLLHNFKSHDWVGV